MLVSFEPKSEEGGTSDLGLDGELSESELGGLLLDLDGLLAGLLLGERLSDGSGLLDSEVQRLVLLAFVGLLEGGPLVVADDGEDSSDRQAHDVDLGVLVWGSSGDL